MANHSTIHAVAEREDAIAGSVQEYRQFLAGKIWCDGGYSFLFLPRVSVVTGAQASGQAGHTQ